jgi:hypothetical protein
MSDESNVVQTLKFTSLKTISSRGFLYCTDIHSKKPMSSNATDIKHLDDFEQFEYMSIYVNSTSLTYFVKNTLPKINHRFFLVSGDADEEVPREVLNEEELQSLLSNKYLVCWFAQNLCRVNHEKAKHLPIGLDFHTIDNEPNHWWRMHTEGVSPVDQEKLLLSFRKKAKPLIERKCRIWSNCHFRPDRYGQRESASKIIPKELVHFEPVYLNRGQCWERSIENAFVLSPFGNGFDCHRTWETLFLGSIPIVKSPQFKDMFEGLPVLMVERWEDITFELLKKTQKEFAEKEWNWEKLSLFYWTSKWQYHLK